jgi:hypothetical protein
VSTAGRERSRGAPVTPVGHGGSGGIPGSALDRLAPVSPLGALAMRRRVLGWLVLAAIAWVAVPAVASAQLAGKVVRIGLLDYAASDSAGAARWKALRERLRELGYVEGQNVVFEARWGDGQAGRLRGLAAQLIDAKVDILVTAGSEAAQAPNRQRARSRSSWRRAVTPWSWGSRQVWRGRAEMSRV